VSARRDDLIELLAKVEAGELVTGRLTCRIWPDCPGHAINAYNGDLNAAKALHEAVLPGWYYTIKQQVSVGARMHVEVTTPATGGDRQYENGYHPTNPARAWLIAILKALIAEAQPAPPPTQEPLI
jgi:hypothetical protein